MGQRWWMWALDALVVMALWRNRVRGVWAKLWSRRRACPPCRAESLVGQTAVVEQPMVPGAKGQVVLSGTVWMARNVGSKNLPAGLTCRITAMEHLTLWVNGDC